MPTTSSDPAGSRLLSDRNSGADLLGYQPYATALARQLTAPGLNTPFTVGIFGSWGTGKSTFLNLLMGDFREQNVDHLLVNPWIFDDREEVWKAFVHSILQFLEMKTDDTGDPEKVTYLAKGLGRLAADVVLRRLSGGDFDLEQVASHFQRTETENTKFLNTFRRRFAEAKAEALGSPDARLIVLVDDLDRCTPESAISILESIKLFFDLSGCVFILAIDRDIIQQGIQLKYREVNFLGVDYLDKMVQLPFSLPPTSSDAFSTFVSSVTRPLGFDESSISLIAGASDGNPRQAKRLANTLAVAWDVAKELPDVHFDDDRKLAALLVLQARYPGVFRAIARRPALYVELSRDTSGARADLIAALEPTYQARSASVVESAAGFVRHVHDDLSIPQFTSDEEIVQYMVLTTVVENPMPTEGADGRKLDDQFSELADVSDRAESDDNDSASVGSPGAQESEVEDDLQGPDEWREWREWRDVAGGVALELENLLGGEQEPSVDRVRRALDAGQLVNTEFERLSAGSVPPSIRDRALDTDIRSQQAHLQEHLGLRKRPAVDAHRAIAIGLIYGFLATIVVLALSLGYNWFTISINIAIAVGAGLGLLLILIYPGSSSMISSLWHRFFRAG